MNTYKEEDAFTFVLSYKEAESLIGTNKVITFDAHSGLVKGHNEIQGNPSCFYDSDEAICDVSTAYFRGFIENIEDDMLIGISFEELGVNLSLFTLTKK